MFKAARHCSGSARQLRWLIAFAFLLAISCAAPVLALSDSTGRDAQVSMIDGTRVAVAEAEVVAPSEGTGSEGEPAPPIEPPEQVEGPKPESPAPEPSEEAGEARPGLERDEALETPEARAARVQSQLAYTGLAPEQAEDLLRQHFALQLEQIDADPSRVLADVALEKVVSPTEALVTMGGEEALLESSVPLRVADEDGELAKVDLGLEETERGYSPANSSTDLSLPRSAAGQIEVGEIALGLAGENAGASTARPFGGDEDLYLPDVAEDTSLLLSPITGGVELSALVASRRSPEQLSFAVEMPAGAQLRAAADGGAEVIAIAAEKQNQPIVRIGAPFAVDAQGTVVPVSLAVKGNLIVLEFAHRSMDIAYPLFIDPEIEENWWGFADTSKLNYWNWQWSGVGPEDFIGWRSCIVTCWGNGLYVRSRSNFQYPGGSFGRWWFVPQGTTTYMRRVIFGPMNMDGHGCWANEPHGYAGVWNNGGFWSVHAPATPSGVTTWVDTGEQNLGPGARTAFVGLHAGGTVKLTCGRDYRMGGAVLFLNDPEIPSVSASGYPTGWVKDNSPFTINVPVYDPGLGVKSATISPKDAPPLSTKELGCTGHYNSQCPANYTFPFSVSADSFDQGEKEVQVSAKDAMLKTSNTFPFMMKVDRTPPDVTIGGQLAIATKEAEGEAKDPTDFDPLSLPVYNLTIEAKDGIENGSAAQRRSGVKSIEVFLDKEKTPRETWTQAPCSNSCGMNKTFTLKLNELTALSHHTLKVVIKDHAGNTPREREIEFEYVPATGMTEEDVLHYFPLPNGQGDEESEENPVRPELAVNVMNGNLVYRQLDTELQGPDADLEVERFYNSLLPESQDTEWGDGWTLAQTPTLEPEVPGAPGDARLVAESGAVESQVDLPEQVGEEIFDEELQAVVSKEVSGYAITDESGASPGTLLFNEAGEATQLEVGEYASVDFDYEDGGIAEIAVSDLASADVDPAQVADAIERARRPVYSNALGSEGTAPGQLRNPADVALDAVGNLWVADKNNHRLQKLTPKGQFLDQFGSAGAGNGQFDRPSSIAIDAQGNIWVADKGNTRVQKFNPDGEYLSQFGSKGTGNGQFAGVGPEAIAIDAQGNIWASDTYGDRIQKFNSQGQFLQAFGQTGTGSGQLRSPTGIDIAPDGNLYVAEREGDRISVFAPSGAFLFNFGASGELDGQFDGPDALTVDADGEVWVADHGNRRVQQFSASGEFIAKFGSAGAGPGQFNGGWPIGIAISDAGRIWVTDSSNHRVQQWAVIDEAEAHERQIALDDDPSVDVAMDDGLVETVEGEEVGEIAYEHDDAQLTAVDGPEGETTYDYDGNDRMTKVTLPNGTYAEIAYEATYGRVKSVTVSIEGASPKTTHFNYEDQPQRRTTVTPPAPDPVTRYEFAADGSMLKWWNTNQPPAIDDIGGTLHDIENRETASPIAPGLYNLTVQAFSAHGIASIQIVANNNLLVSEKTCAQIPGEPVECEKETDEWVLETGTFAPGILYLEVIATNALGESASERFWVNIPYTPPPDPEAEEPPKFSDLLKFREDFGLDLDLKGDEEAVNDRIYNLIGDWNNPNTPAGEVARASAGKWGVPMRLVDVAEMEYRESYIGHNGPLIEQWGEEKLPASYAGYYVAHSDGGTLRIGFTDHPAEHLSALVNAVHPVAPGRIEAYTAAANSSFALLKGVEESISAASFSNGALASSLRSIELSTELNKVVVTSVNPASTSVILAEIVGPTAPVKVIGSAGPYIFNRLLAGENLRTHRVTSTHEFSSFCTAGPGAFEWRPPKANGERIRAEFLLTAGHCFEVEGENGVVEKSIYPRGTTNFTSIGHKARNALLEQHHYETDAQAIRLRGYHGPRYIYRPYRAPLSVEPPARFDQGQVLCYSGVHSGVVRCGTAIGIRSIEIPEPFHGRMLNIKFEPKSGDPPGLGDSGAPVWEAGTNRIVGLISGNEDGYAFIAPMLQPRGFPAEKVPGILNAPGMGNLTLKTGP